MRPARHSGSKEMAFHLHRGSRRKQEVETGCQTQRHPPSNAVLPLARLDLLQVPLPAQIVPPIGGLVCKYMNSQWQEEMELMGTVSSAKKLGILGPLLSPPHLPSWPPVQSLVSSLSFSSLLSFHLGLLFDYTYSVAFSTCSLF